MKHTLSEEELRRFLCEYVADKFDIEQYEPDSYFTIFNANGEELDGEFAVEFTSVDEQ